MSDTQSSFVPIVETIAQCRRFVLWSFSTSAFVCLLALLCLPRQYTAKMAFLPVMPADVARDDSIPKSVFVLGNLAGQFTQRAVCVLGSRTLKEEIVKNLELTKVYDVESMERAVEILSERTKLETLHDGPISIEVSDRSPQRAASIANEYARQLYSPTENYQFLPLKILDNAVPPIRPSKPRKGIIIFATVLLTTLLNLITLYYHKFTVDLREQNPGEFEKLLLVQMTLRNDLQRLCFWREKSKDKRNGPQNGCISGRYPMPRRIAELPEPTSTDRIDA